MEDVERMYRHLVRTIRASFPQYLTQPFEVGELYQTILPYRLHRRELGLETNQDYELALMELLSGANGYLVVDGKMRDDLSAERTAASPNTAKIREFALQSHHDSSILIKFGNQFPIHLPNRFSRITALARFAGLKPRHFISGDQFQIGLGSDRFAHLHCGSL